MLQRSPIIRFALEVLQHALESYCSERARDRKIAILNLAQAVELAVKAALVERNISIYEKGNRTLNHHDALQHLAKLWSAEKLSGQARLELLIDERNAIQHRYGAVDDVTLDYHMQTAFDVLDEILRKEFDTELSDWIRDNIDQSVWERVRFVTGEDDAQQTPSSAIIDERSPTLDFVDGFSRYERTIRQRVLDAGGDPNAVSSTLDLILKALSNAPAPPQQVIRSIPIAYKLRNRVIHGEDLATAEEVQGALETLDRALEAFADVPHDIVTRALEASRRRVKGTRLDASEAVPISADFPADDEGSASDAGSGSQAPAL